MVEPFNAEKRARGVVYGTGLDFRPQPAAGEILPSPIRLADVAYMPVPRRTWRDRLRLFLQAGGLITVPSVSRARWQARDMIEGLQASLLSKGRGRRTDITHPCQMMPAIEILMGLPPELSTEQRILHRLIGRALVEYRDRIGQVHGHPVTFSRKASEYFAVGSKIQRQIGCLPPKSDKFTMMQNLYSSYYFFKCFYIFAILSREAVEVESKLFSKYMKVAFFLSAVRNDGTIDVRPSCRLLPPREHVVFLAKRDGALQARLREDERLRVELQQILRYFQPMMPAAA